jgi:hypothetical protein
MYNIAMEEELPQEIPFDGMTLDQKRQVVGNTLETIQARMDNARITGVDMGKREGDSKFRLEDEADPNKVLLLYAKIMGIENKLFPVRKERRVSVGDTSIFDFNDKGKSTRIILSNDDDEHSRNAITGDINIQATYQKTKIRLKIIHHDSLTNFWLEIDFPKSPDFEPITYNTTDLINPMNNEEYKVISYMVEKAREDYVE